MAFSGSLPPISLYGDWVLPVQLLDSETGDSIDLTGCKIDLYLVRGPDCPEDYGWRSAALQGSPIASTTSGEITIPQAGIFVVTILKADGTSRLYSLSRGFYQVVIIVSRGGETEPLLIGMVPIL